MRRSKWSLTGGASAHGREELDEAVGLVGVVRGAAENQRTLVTQRVVHVGLLEDARDLAFRVVVTLAQRERPRRGEPEPRPPIDLGRGEAIEPVEHRRLSAVGHGLVQALLGEVVGELPLARFERLPRRLLEQAVRGEPLRRASADPGLLCRRQRGEPPAQDVAGERVQPQPFAPLHGDEHRRVAREALEPLGGVRRAGHRAAEVRMKVVHDGDAREERRVGVGEVGHQAAEQVRAQVARAGGDRADGGRGRPARARSRPARAASRAASPRSLRAAARRRRRRRARRSARARARSSRRA